MAAPRRTSRDHLRVANWARNEAAAQPGKKGGQTLLCASTLYLAAGRYFCCNSKYACVRLPGPPILPATRCSAFQHWPPSTLTVFPTSTSLSGRYIG